MELISIKKSETCQNLVTMDENAAGADNNDDKNAAIVEDEVKLVNRKGNTDTDNQEKQKYMKEIENILSEIHLSVKQRKLNEDDLAKVIDEINNEAINLEIDNKILNLVHELIFVNFRKDMPLYHQVPWQKQIMLIILAIIYIFDIFANIFLCVTYTLDKNYVYSFVTFIFYLLPSIFISYSVLKRLKIFLHIICIICNLSPVICCFETISIANKIASKRKENNIEGQIKHYNDLKDIYVLMDKVKQFVGFLHCGPQLTYQLALFLYMCKSGAPLPNLYFQLFLISTSLFGLIAAIETRFRGHIFKKLWLFPIIVARILSICILVLKRQFRVYTILFLFIHWMFIACWWYYKKARNTELPGIEKFLFSTTEAVVSTFIPIKFLDTDIHFYLYLIHFIENILANVIWTASLNKLDHSTYIYALIIGINITYFLFGMTIKVIGTKFTQYFRSNTNITEDIRC